MSSCYYYYSCSYDSVTVSGADYSERIYGNCGDDYLYGNGGHDKLYGGRGNDEIYGGSGCDVLYGGSGEDELFGGTGSDYLYGGYGNDRLTGGADNDVLYGGRGTDTAVFSGSVCDYTVSTVYYYCKKYTKVVGTDGTDFLRSVEILEFDDIVIDLKACNNGPLAKADAFEVNEDDTLVISDADLIANDFDWEGDTLTVVGVTSGTIDVSRAPDGTITITPGAAYDYLAAGETAEGTFTYTIEDEHGEQSTATVTVTVIGEDEPNTDPVAMNDDFTVGENGILVQDILFNDDDADGDDITIVSANGNLPNTAFSVTSTGGRTGTAIVAEDGAPNIVFDTDDNFDDLGAGDTDTVEITYEISDGNGGTSSATVTITVEGENDDPVAMNDDFTVGENGILVEDILFNDGDVDGDDITIVSANGNLPGTTFSVVSAGGRTGTAIVAEDGAPNIVFDTDDNFDDLGAGDTDTVEITYEISDGNGGTSSATATITVEGENDDPIAVGEYFSVQEDTGFAYALLLNDSDVDGDDLTVTDIEGNGPNSTFTVTSAFGRTANVLYQEDGTPNFIFAPTTDFLELGEGTYDVVEMDYTVSDGMGGSAIATATVYITGDSQVEASFGTYFTGPIPTGVDIIEF